MFKILDEPFKKWSQFIEPVKIRIITGWLLVTVIQMQELHQQFKSPPRHNSGKILIPERPLATPVTPVFTTIIVILVYTCIQESKVCLCVRL